MQYEIKGGNLPVVICTLEPNETLISESGAMSWMSANMDMQTSGGGVGKALGRVFSGESLMRNIYTAKGGKGTVAFASSFPGSIAAIRVSPGRSVIAQKSAFLACEPGVEMSVFFQKKVGAGVFGGEGFIMQQFSGSGIVFLEIDGSSVQYELASGEQMIVDTGYLAMMDDTCKMEIQAIKGMKNILFGGEGLFNTVVTGPGRIVLQTMPVTSFVSTISRFLPKSSN